MPANSTILSSCFLLTKGNLIDGLSHQTKTSISNLRALILPSSDNKAVRRLIHFQPSHFRGFCSTWQKTYKKIK